MTSEKEFKWWLRVLLFIFACVLTTVVWLLATYGIKTPVPVPVTPATPAACVAEEKNWEMVKVRVCRALYEERRVADNLKRINDTHLTYVMLSCAKVLDAADGTVDGWIDFEPCPGHSLETTGITGCSEPAD
jgi:hypothetical protein